MPAAIRLVYVSAPLVCCRSKDLHQNLSQSSWCHAASTWDRGLWDDILAHPLLLSKCTAKHVGRVALQLLATWVCNKHRPEDSVSKTLVDDTISTVWCGESLTSARMYT